ncbi:MAG TPA: xanthine dehydrogenase family protein molybdopterin-binding subunit [Anaerolineaceae bacterium]|nr:xanthine dehydrogenase family protein molybdopterin-binding subunit [Anaerolineaceae bacterium]
MPAKKTSGANPDSPVGDSVIRLDAREKVTGAAMFADDFQFGPNLLHARIVRSPHAHALIKKIDVSKALALPGVKVVVTGESFDGMLGLYLSDRYIFCRDRVRYVGDAVAGIAATSEEIAEKATRLVEVEYEVLPSVFDPEEGTKPEAAVLHPDLGNYAYPNFIFPEPGTNIANRFKVRKGDVDEAFKHCAAIVERRYKVPQIQHVPIEPHVSIAQADMDGNVTLWASSQSPFAQRNLIAKALHISQSKLRVIAPFVGGGFGSKAGVSMEALAVAIALKIPGRPVRLVLTREEEFYASFVRQGLVAYYKMGCDKDGNLIAVDNKYFWDAGAYTEYGVNITRASGYSSTGPYNVPNVRVDSLCVYTNHPVGGPMRGFGMPEIHVGLEQCVDDMAEAVGIDPVEFRRKNCVKGGDIIVTGMVMHPTGLSRCIEQAAKAIQWGKINEPSGPNKKRGKGIAVMWKAPAMTPNAGSSAWVRLNEDATVEIGLGGQEIGQGTFTVMAQMAAAALGVPYEWVKVARPVDTKYSPYEWQTVASRLTWSMGNAVRNAALDARKQILDLVAQAWEEKVDDLDVKDGYVISYRSEETISLKNIVIYGIAKKNDQGWMGGPVVGRGQFMPTYVTGLDRETGQGPRAVVHYTTGAQAVEVEVDMTTGRVEIVDAVSAFDVGHAINPDNVRAQMEGGFVQGLSSALLEAMLFNKDGVMRNPSFVDYRIATSSDAPKKIQSIIVEEPQDDGPWGARGIGEHSMVPTIPAIANAIYNAIGIRVGNPPFTPEKVFLAMLEAGIVK